jgi:mRNA interferase RelE/StbE
VAWRVELEAGARKDLRAIRDVRLRGRIVRALQGLETDPRPPDAKRLAGHSGVWRVRVGDWRIAYAIRDEVLVVLVVAVGTRGAIYEKLRRRDG